MYSKNYVYGGCSKPWYYVERLLRLPLRLLASTMCLQCFSFGFGIHSNVARSRRKRKHVSKGQKTQQETQQENRNTGKGKEEFLQPYNV